MPITGFTLQDFLTTSHNPGEYLYEYEGDIMGEAFDVRNYFKIDPEKPLELRICHIATLWYKEVQPGSMQNHLDTIYNLFPELVIVKGQNPQKATIPPEINYTTNYITAYEKRDKGYLYQGPSSDIVQIINCLYGSSVDSPKLTGPANVIQKRIFRELRDDISKLSGLREYYRAEIISKLSPQQLERFKLVFKSYIDAVVVDLEKPSEYRSLLFPFLSDRLVIDLYNYLSEELKRGNYADFFLWMNLGALLRNEINPLMDKYDSFFNRRNKKPSPSPAGGAMNGISKCLTRI